MKTKFITTKGLIALMTTIFMIVVIPTQAQQQLFIQEAIVDDGSKSQDSEVTKIVPSEVMNKTVNRVDLYKNGIEYTQFYVVLGHRSIPEIDTIYIPKYNYWWTKRDVREKQIQEVKTRMYSKLDSISRLPKDQKFSSLYRGMVTTISAMDHDATKTVYVFTDGIENGVANFYDVKDWNEEYDTLRKALLDDTPMPQNIKNLTIVFVNNGTYENSLQSIRFWIKFFSEYDGIKATVRALM